MYKFTIEYYCMRYHTRELNTKVTRTATVCAENLGEAKKKIAKADNDYEAVASVSFEEMTEEKS